MRSILAKIIGIILIIAAIGGLLFSLAGLGIVWGNRSRVTTDLETGLTNFSLTLANTGSALDIADNSLKGTITAIAALKTAVEKTADTVDTSMAAVDNVADLTKNTLPNTVEAAQTSLRSAQDAAKVVDDFLTTLSGLPFVPDFYKPTTPLNVALGNVIDKLDTVPQSLRNIGDSVSTSSSKMKDFRTSFQEFPALVQNIADNLQEAEGVIAQYKTTVADLKTKVDYFAANISRIVYTIALVLSLILVWLLAAQLALAVEGLRLLGVRIEPAPPVPAQPVPGPAELSPQSKPADQNAPSSAAAPAAK